MNAESAGGRPVQHRRRSTKNPSVPKNRTPAQSAQPKSESPAPLRILLVENHADTLKILRSYLEMLGHTVFAAASIKEALKVFPTAGCKVLISDIGLPDGSGWELLEQIRSPIYAIAMSGFGLNADSVRSHRVGYRHHLVKPFVTDELDIALLEAAREIELEST